jgi:hypothetical protein
MCTEKTILSMQFVAAFFMAFDYFFDDEQRKKVNAVVKSVAQPIQDRIDKDIDDYLGYVVQQWAYITTSLLFVAVAWLGFEVLPLFAPSAYPWITALIALLLLGLFAGGFPRLLTVVIAGITPLVIGGSLRLITIFLIRCPKGSIFGIGFVILMAAFACRFSNLPQ